MSPLSRDLWPLNLADTEFEEEFKLTFKSCLPTSCFKLDQGYGK